MVAVVSALDGAASPAGVASNRVSPRGLAILGIQADDPSGPDRRSFLERFDDGEFGPVPEEPADPLARFARVFNARSAAAASSGRRLLARLVGRPSRVPLRAYLGFADWGSGAPDLVVVGRKLLDLPFDADPPHASIALDALETAAAEVREALREAGSSAEPHLYLLREDADEVARWG